MAPKAKCVALAKTTKMVLKGNEGVEKKEHYRGVQKRDSGRYSVEIKYPWKKSCVWLGTFDTTVEAAKAYDAAGIKFCGIKAKMNFPFPAPPVNFLPRQNSSVQLPNATLAVESPLPLDLSFERSYSSSSVGLSTNGIGNHMCQNPKFLLSPIASSFLPLNQWCCKKAVFIQGEGRGGYGATVPITGASSVIDFMGSMMLKNIDIDLNYPPALEDM
ncbi:hypothetical protein H5410_061341 [Solanum commersonii]|uniref:AP2/ERF domain-containing protein n=1 Tax=Solanum commersonii TaxID=4109 RepID=A0A9J5W8B7_SOLCO|nr:hypothetical protein H5410_061341 [Solanum commersonii]